MSYAAVKSIHLISITITLVLFLTRAWWMLTESKLLYAKPVRILPHVNDTFLFIAGFWLAAMLGQYPFQSGWLTAKLIALIAYIVLGAFALHYGKTKGIRIICLIAAMSCFGYVIAVAATKNPLVVF